MKNLRWMLGTALLMLIAACGEKQSAEPSAPASPAPSSPSRPAPAPAPAETPAPSPAPSEASARHVPLNYLIGNIDPASDPAFARIPDKYVGGSRVWGQKDAVAAFIRMADDAAANGYKLKIVSAF